MASRKFNLILSLLLSVSVLAQKNLVAVSSSAYTGIDLPAGTRQDKRLFNVAMVMTFLEGETKKFNVTVSDAEVFRLPPGTNHTENLKASLNTKGWEIRRMDERPEYAWLIKQGQYYFMYWSFNLKNPELYFGKLEGVPASENSLPVVSNQPVNQQPPVAKTTLSPVQQSTSSLATTVAQNIHATWYKSSATSGNTAYGYIKCQYSFNPDGSFIFYRKTFDVYNPQMVLRKESGTYVVSGNTLTINPAASVIETWSKRDGADQWGSVIKSENPAPEKINYNFKFHYFGEKLNLLLSPANGQTTKRDGVFGTNSDFPNTYFYEMPPDDSYLIELPESAKPTVTEKQSHVVAAIQPAQQSVAQPKLTGGFTYWVTNWDDGWFSTIENDKVVVTKGGTRVHLYFTLLYDDVSRNAGRDFYWDNHLTKEFRILTKQYRDHGEVISSFQAPYIEGTAIDPKTGKNCFIAMFVTSASGNMFPVVAITPDEATHRQLFPKAEDNYNSDLAAMSRYNRFAVALNDIVGTWSGGGSAAANYYNAYTGAYAGMGAVAMSDKFEFFANGDYVSKHQGASGMVGSMSTYSQEYKGKATVSNWEIILPNRWEGKTSKYHAWFEAVRGGRILNLQDMQYSGSRYSLVKEQ